MSTVFVVEFDEVGSWAKGKYYVHYFPNSLGHDSMFGNRTTQEGLREDFLSDSSGAVEVSSEEFYRLVHEARTRSVERFRQTHPSGYVHSVDFLHDSDYRSVLALFSAWGIEVDPSELVADYDEETWGDIYTEVSLTQEQCKKIEELSDQSTFNKPVTDVTADDLMDWR